MTDREKAIVMAYTGITMLTGDKLEVFYKYVESLVNRPIFTHELAYIDLKALSKNDFLELCAKKEMPRGYWGKWVISEVRCPECLEYYDTDCFSKDEMTKCPNCGAQMCAETTEDVQEGDK